MFHPISDIAMGPDPITVDRFGWVEDYLGCSNMYVEAPGIVYGISYSTGEVWDADDGRTSMSML